jgi:hypothetical protein
MKKIFLLVFINGLTLCQAFSFSIDDIDFSKFQNDIYWQKIMHYQPSMKGFLTGQSLRGQADGESYYYSKEGKWNLEDEARESLKAFMSPPMSDPNLHPQCRFPERYRYLKEKLQAPIQDLKCPDFEEWMNSLDPVGAALVFASNYPNNPGSAMGHTFIRIISRKTSRLQKGQFSDSHLDLLDYSISYAAYTTEEKGIGYALKGLMGGYAGQFSMEPYYMKVREYSTGEGRDIWEYELNLDENAVRRMVANFWEVSRNTFFNYYFIDENCSFHMLTMLDVAKPEWNISEKFYLYTVPYETVKKINQIPEAVKNIKYRPSLPKRLNHTIDHLSDHEKDDFKKILEGKLSLENYSQHSTFLEALASYIQFQKIENKMQFMEGHEVVYKEALVLRSKLGIRESKVSKIEMPEFDRPEYGHSPSQVAFGLGNLENGLIQQLTLKTALHDLLSRDAGFSPNTRMNFFSFTLSGYEKNNEYKLNLDEVVFLDMLSLTPTTKHEYPISWAIKIGYVTPLDQATLRRETFHLNLGAGLTFKPIEADLTLYSFGMSQMEYATYLTENARLGLVWHNGAIFKINEKMKFFLENNFIQYVFDKTNNHLQSSLSSTFTFYANLDLEFRLNAIYFNQSLFQTEKATDIDYLKTIFSTHYNF